MTRLWRYLTRRRPWLRPTPPDEAIPANWREELNP